MTTNLDPQGNGAADRLDRIEALLGVVADRQIATQQQLDQSIAVANARAETIFLAIGRVVEQQRETQTQLQASIEDVVQMIADRVIEAAEIRADIHEMQSEVRGLQTENRRILDILQRQQGDDLAT
jgi:hypothetical protein